MGAGRQQPVEGSPGLAIERPAEDQEESGGAGHKGPDLGSPWPAGSWLAPRCLWHLNGG